MILCDLDELSDVLFALQPEADSRELARAQVLTKHLDSEWHHCSRGRPRPTVAVFQRDFLVPGPRIRAAWAI